MKKQANKSLDAEAVDAVTEVRPRPEDSAYSTRVAWMIGIQMFVLALTVIALLAMEGGVT